jgi:2',3'-cyclic-nucleotide 2'-phosphodiesterase (5'-nucleotidase family)
MLDSVNAHVAATYGTPATAYNGPNGDGQLDGRITRDGDGDDTYEAGEVVPLTILHHNDSHGRLLKTTSGTTTNAGYSQLVTLIEQERALNPDRTLLLSSGDNIQGDSMMYFFKSAGLGYSADGTALDPELQINPLIKAFNAVGYDAWTLGNHEFNFGADIFGTLAQADFPILQANISDAGAYGIADIPVEPYVVKTVGDEEIDVAILGIGNHRVPSYELPSNIPGLTFTNPVQAGKDLAPDLAADNDAVIALTHIGFTTDPKSVEVDENVDTIFASQVPGVDAVIGGHSHTRPDTGYGDYKFLPTFVAGPDGSPVLVTQAYRYNTYLGEVVLGFLPDGSGGYDVVSSAGRYLAVNGSTTPEDPEIVALVQPYQDLISVYNNTVIGSTTVPIDTNSAFTEETNGANLQADASVWKLESEGIPVDVHLSGAMTNRRIADTATPTTPYELKVSDMFAAMPYENSLVVMRMNGPQLKAVLERAYRNYYYYKYVPGYGGYSYYTTCMLDTDKLGKITYNDLAPALPNGHNVVSFKINGVEVNFADATKYYRVSTVNYLAAGACNFSEGGKTLWPLNQIVADTQYYVRDAVIEYVDAQTAPVAPAIEGRLAFLADATGPAISISTPAAQSYGHARIITVAFAASDTPAGLASVTAKLDGTAIKNGARLDLLKYKLGNHTLVVTAVDKAGNTATESVTFKVIASTSTLITTVKRYYDQGAIKSRVVRDRLLVWLKAARNFEEAGMTRWAIVSLASFQVTVGTETPNRITRAASKVLIDDAIYTMAQIRKVKT